jgi:hypothetical protein
MSKEYQLTDDDLAEIGRRMARGEDLIIPIRSDIELIDGRIAENCLTWGHPNAYKIVKVSHTRECIFYGRSKLED